MLKYLNSTVHFLRWTGHVTFLYVLWILPSGLTQQNWNGPLYIFRGNRFDFQIILYFFY